MRKRVIYGAGATALALLAWGATVAVRLPEAGAPAAKLIFFYGPAALAALAATAAAVLASLLFLRTKDMRHDALAVSATEAGLVFLAANLVTGCLWNRALRGAWWTWDPAVTSVLVCGLIYASYLMLRRAIEEPSQRATYCAVWSVFCFVDSPIVAAAVYRWRSEHPHPALWAGIPAGWLEPLAWNAAGMLAVGVVLIAVRYGQENTQRELDTVRRSLQVM